MTNTVVWIDREHAKLFQFSQEKMERTHLKAGHPDHHTHRPDQFDHQKNENAFFGGVAKYLQEAGRIMIVGPGVAKHHFQNFLNEHFPATSKKVIACEAMDHPTDAQIAAYAKKFFNLVA